MNFDRAALNGAFGFFKKRGMVTNNFRRDERERVRESERERVPKMKSFSLSDRQGFYDFMTACGIPEFRFFDHSSWDEFRAFCEQNPEPWNPIMKAWRAGRCGHIVPANAQISCKADLERYRTPQRTAKADKVKILREQTIREFIDGGKK